MDCTEDLVFDVGAHRGEDSDFYLKMGYRVVAVEANPVLVQGLKERFADEIRNGTLTLVDKAIGENDGQITFYVNKQLSIWGTANPDWVARNRGLGTDSEEITVPCTRFGELITRFGCPYYVKIDIEGADMLCVRGLAEVAQRPRYISIESAKTSWRGLLKEFNALERLGYDRFQIVDQRTHGSGSFRDRSGARLEHRFAEGSSGPFGEALTGQWLTRSQAIRRYIPIFLLYYTLGDNRVWLPKLAKRVPFLRRLQNKVSWYDTHATRSVT